jgi:hypothetical protein
MGQRSDLRIDVLNACLGRHPGALSKVVCRFVYPDLPHRTAFRRLEQAEAAGLVARTRCKSDPELWWTSACPDGRHRHIWPTARLKKICKHCEGVNHGANVHM